MFMQPMHIFCVIGWKHVGEIRFTESLALWSIRAAPFLPSLVDHAHILHDWQKTCEMIFTESLVQWSKDCPFLCIYEMTMHIFFMIG